MLEDYYDVNSAEGSVAKEQMVEDDAFCNGIYWFANIITIIVVQSKLIYILKRQQINHYEWLEEYLIN